MRLAVATVACLVLSSSAPPPEGFELPPRLEALLTSGRWDATPRGFRIIVLSHVADGCAAQGARFPSRRAEALACVDRVLAQAWKTQPARSLDGVGDGLWLTHLALILGARHPVGDCASPALHERVARRLAALSLADPLRHAPSYSALAPRWPADQAATLAALHRFDAAHGAALTAAPLRAWEGVLAERGLHAPTGLPVSDVSGTMGGAGLPRGCAQSFISRYLAEADAPLAAAWWARYREHFLTRLGPVVGFREWPRGVERRADVDSGPIIAGIGAAASALAIAAARAQGDDLLAAQLEASAATVLGSGQAQGVEGWVLADAILFQARWQPLLVDGGS